MSDDASNPEEIAKRAAELAARAEELSRQAADAAASDEQLRRLDAELLALEAEEARLDEDLGLGGDVDPGPDESASSPPTPGDWSGTFAGSMDLLGERIASTVSRALDGAFAKTPFDDVVEHRHEVSGPLRVRVTNGGGKVEVRPGSGDAVVVNARRRSRDPDRARVDVRIEPEEGGVHVSVVGRRRWRGNDGAHLEIRVPATSPVDVTTGGGSIDIADTDGPVSARTGGGGVRVQGVREAYVTTGGGGIRVEALDGEIRAMTGGGSIRVAGRVRGESSLTTGGGSIHVELDPESQIEVVAVGQVVRSEIPGVDTGRGHVAGHIGTGADGRLKARTGGGSIVLRRGVRPAGDAHAD